VINQIYHAGEQGQREADAGRQKSVGMSSRSNASIIQAQRPVRCERGALDQLSKDDLIVLLLAQGAGPAAEMAALRAQLWRSSFGRGVTCGFGRRSFFQKPGGYQEC
jgi:hypothetical protein